MAEMDKDDDIVTLAHDRHSVLGATVERKVTINNGRELRNHLAVYPEGFPPVNNTTWIIPEVENAELAMQTLNFHWRRLRREFEEAMQEAEFYHIVKNTDDDKTARAMHDEFLQNIADSMLNMQMSEDDIREGRNNPDHYPLSTISHRMHAIRLAGLALDMPLDVYENALEKLESKLEMARHHYDRAFGGLEGGELMMAGPDEGDGDFYDDEDEEREEHDDEPWLASTGLDDMPWQEVEDADDERDNRLAILFTDFLNYMADFTTAANNLWIEAVMQAYNRETITLNAHQIALMREDAKQAKRAYQRLREASNGMAVAEYELKPFFALIEDKNHGMEARLDGLIELASKPAQLEIMIKKHINIQRDEEQGRGMA